MTKTNIFLIIVIVLLCGALWKYCDYRYSPSQLVWLPDNVADGYDKLYPVTGCESDWTQIKISLYQYENYPNDYVVGNNFPPQCRDESKMQIIPFVFTTPPDVINVTSTGYCDDNPTGDCNIPNPN